MPVSDAETAQPETGKEPRTERGRRTQEALLEAAVKEFGAKGFHATGITDITRAAGVALGSFYTWFESKEVLYRAVVAHLTAQLRDFVGPRIKDVEGAIPRERVALAAFLEYVDRNSLIYRIIDEAEFVAPETHRAHYETTVERIRQRLAEGAAKGQLRADVGEVEAWAVAGMNVFLGLRYGIWGTPEEREEVVNRANRLLAEGLAARD